MLKAMNYHEVHFALVGPGKTGTVWLSQCIREHSEIFVTRETNFLTHYRERGWEYWSRHFDGRGTKTILGEYAGWYSTFACVPGLLAKHNPALKIVFSIRDPVKRAISNYRHDRAWGTLGRHVPLGHAVQQDLFFHRYIEPGRYSVHIRRYLDHFPPEQIILFQSPSDSADTEESLYVLFRFLGAQPERPASLSRVLNKTSAPPLFPALHHEAYFGSSRAARVICRALDMLNVHANSADQHEIPEHDVSLVREMFISYQERESLASLIKSSDLQGSVDLDRWSV